MPDQTKKPTDPQSTNKPSDQADQVQDLPENEVEKKQAEEVKGGVANRFGIRT